MISFEVAKKKNQRKSRKGKQVGRCHFFFITLKYCLKFPKRDSIPRFCLLLLVVSSTWDSNFKAKTSTYSTSEVSGTLLMRFSPYRGSVTGDFCLVHLVDHLNLIP